MTAGLVTSDWNSLEDKWREIQEQITVPLVMGEVLSTSAELWGRKVGTGGRMAIAGALDEFKMVSYSSFAPSGAYSSSSSSSSCCWWAPVAGDPGVKRVTEESLWLIHY